MNVEYVVVGLISAFSAISVTLLANYLQLIKWKGGEKELVDSDAANKITAAAAMLINPLREEVEDLRYQNVTLKTQIEDIGKEWNEKFVSIQKDYIEIQRELALFKNWAERLTFQIKSYGKVPVPFLPEDLSPNNIDKDKKNE